MSERPVIHVSVVCAAPDRVFLRELQLPQGANVNDAIEASGFRQAWPEVPISDERLGIFARKADPGTVLNDGDRVEIYRPLKIDPKDARRRRAKKS
jgi:putative ubiquitin-RnfH superfamily antitoxin RatB of RatAB toxin-antitoxin module